MTRSKIKKGSPKISTAERARQVLKVVKQVPVLHYLGIKPVRLGRGTSTFAVRFTQRLAQVQGILHGGILATLADTAATFASHMLLVSPQETITIELKINYLRPVGSGRAIARARVLHCGQRTTVTVVDVKNQKGQLCATVLVTNLIIVRRI